MRRRTFNELVDFAAATFGYDKEDAEEWAFRRLMDEREKPADDGQLELGKVQQVGFDGDDWGGF